MSIAETYRFRKLSQKERKAEKEKDSADGGFKRRLAHLVDLVNKRAHSRYNRMVEKYYPKNEADTAIVCTQVNFKR